MKLLLLTALTALTGLTLFGGTCQNFTYTGGAPEPTTNCTIDGGAVTLSGFDLIGVTHGETVTVDILNPGATNELSGISFEFGKPSTQGPYTVSYNATVAGGTVIDVNDSATPFAATYDYAGTGFSCGPNVATCIQSVMTTGTFHNSGTYTGYRAPSQTLTLDFIADPPTATPEPLSAGLVGLGLLGVGLGAARRRKVSL